MEDKFIYLPDDLDSYTSIDTYRISDLFFIKNYKVCWVTGLIDLDNFTTIPVGYRPNTACFLPAVRYHTSTDLQYVTVGPSGAIKAGDTAQQSGKYFIAGTYSLIQ
jgi:hypothetical protein